MTRDWRDLPGQEAPAAWLARYQAQRRRVKRIRRVMQALAVLGATAIAVVLWVLA